MSLLDGLNPRQRKAAEITKGPLLVVAGAGTGKTRTLTHRIAHLIESGVEPWRILAITFTNKAAAEMKERITELIECIPGNKHDGSLPMVKTFHALGVYLMRVHHEKFGLPKHFTILDSADQLQIMKDVMRERGFDPKQHDPRVIRRIISNAQNALKTRQEFAAQVSSPAAELAALVWERYDAEKKKLGVVDFDDLIIRVYRLLESDEEIRTLYQNKWHYVHIDEYQDTNVVQYKLAEILSHGHKNLCVVGDGDQNIYSWRGASLRNILQFEKDFPGAQTVILEENYRSTKAILRAAEIIIEKNTARVPKVLRTENADGNPIYVYTAFSETDEARFVTRTVKDLVQQGTDVGDIAVLFRTNFQSRVIEEAFLYADLPYQLIGTKFFDRKEVKDIIAFLQYVVNDANKAALARIVNVPKRGLGKTSVAKIVAGDANQLTAKAFASYQAFEKNIADIREYLADKPLSQTITYVLKKTGYETMLLSGSADERERLENLKELVSYATRFDDQTPDEALTNMLEAVALMSDQDTDKSAEGNRAVRLMTIHASKGLEFDTVFIVGLEQGLFPSGRGDDSERDSEEERRLMYVAVTRARQNLYLSHAQMRRIFGKTAVQIPSEFLQDIPEDMVEIVGEAPSRSGGTGLLDDWDEIIF